MSLSDARARFTELVERARTTHLRTSVTKNGEPAVVIMSIEDYESMEETIEVLSDQVLVAAIRDHDENPNAKTFSLDDVKQRVADRKARV